MDPSNIQEWGQQLAIVATTIIGIFVAIYKYTKTETSKSKPPAAAESSGILAASFIDTRVLKDLIDTIREATEEVDREGRKNSRVIGDLRQSMEELNENIKLQTEVTHAVLRYLNRQRIK